MNWYINATENVKFYFLNLDFKNVSWNVVVDHVSNFIFVMQLTEQKIWKVIKNGRQRIGTTRYRLHHVLSDIRNIKE